MGSRVGRCHVGWEWPLLALILALLAAPRGAQGQPAPEAPTIARLLPPLGGELAEARRAALTERLAQLHRDAAPHAGHPLAADVDALLKAVELALAHTEFYSPKDPQLADQVLDEAARRIGELQAGAPSWPAARGLVVRGFRSAIDGAPQPYGLELPAELDARRPTPLYVWLHGRGDKATDLHFIAQRLTRPGQIQPRGAIVLHPFGRHCLGYKSAGETDVLEAIAHVREHYPVDPDRIVLIGFSMGGAGAWHLGAHHADQFVAVSPGAGFAETARYNRLSTAEFPRPVERTLWGVYDVPDYVRDLFNTSVIAYSGELDKQIQAARVMEEAYRAEGRELTHLIGPGVEHKYHPETLAELLRRLDELVARGRERRPERVHLQTRTLRYSRQHWVEATGLLRHWEDSRIDAELAGPREVRATTRNVERLRLSPWLPMRGATVVVDGTRIELRERAADGAAHLVRGPEGWREAPADSDRAIRKRPGLQGPIDDLFLEPFLVVTPSRPAAHPHVDAWVRGELEHFRARWRALCRGELREKVDTEVTPDDLRRFHLVLWGDPRSNAVLRQLVEGTGQGTIDRSDTLGDWRFPLAWDERRLALAGGEHSAADHVPVLIAPNPLAPRQYVVLNSGPTFREQHDRTNSLQNPKLGDWAVLSLDVPPGGERAGRIVAEGFWDESWR